MASNLKGIIVEIGGDTTNLQRALSKVNSATSSLSKELKGINSLLKLDPKNTELLSQKQAVLKENIEKVTSKLKSLNDVQDQVKKKWENYKKVEPQLTSLKNKIEETSNTLKKLQEKQEKATEAFKNGKISQEQYDNIKKSVEECKNTLSELKKEQKELSKNTVTTEAYRDYQREIANTKIKLNDLKKTYNTFMLEQDKWNVNGKKVEEFGDKIVKVSSKIDNLGSKFTTRFSLPIIALGTLGTKSAMEQEASMQQVEKIYGEASDTIKEFANNTALSYNMSSKSAYKYSQIFGNLIQSMTDDQTKNAQYTQDLLKASSVIASATGRTMEDVMDRIRSGLLGNTEAIEDLGVNVNVSLLESTDAFKRFAGDKSWNQLDFQTQQQIRLFGILEQTTKKYGDEVNVNTTSKVQKLTSKLENMGSKLSSKLLPIVDKWIDKADKWIDKLDDMDDATLDNIIRIGLFVAAAGPVLKIFGKLGSAIGTVIKTTGQFSQAIAVVKTGAKSTSASVNLLASGIKGLISPFGIATLAIAAVTAEIAIMDKKLGENLRNTKEYTQTIKDNINSRKELADSQIEQMNGNISEINYIRNLNQELKNIVDENGKVKDGYQERVNFILNELNNALGTEYTLNGNIIDAYQTMQKEIDNLINKKRAQIVIETQEEQYREAIQNKTKDYQELILTQDKLAEAQKRRNDAENEFLNAQKYGGNAISTMKYKKAIDEVNELTDTYNKQKEVVEKNNTAINKYEKNVELMAKGTKESYDQIYQSINEVQTSVTATEQTEMAKRIENLQYNLEESRRMYNLEAEYNKNAKDNIYATNVEESEKNLQLAIDELTKATSTVGEMSPDVIQAWKNLATNSREEYKTALSKMSQDMQDRINNITGVVNSDTSVKDAAKFLGQEAVNQLNISSKFEEAGKNWIKGVSKGINNKLLRQEALSSMHSFGVEGLNAIRQQAWDEHSPSKETEKAAINLLKGIPKGINKEKSNTINSMLKFGQELMNKFNGSMSLNFNSLQNIPQLQSSISQTISTQLQPKILQPNIVINTQHLDNNEMNRIIDTVNRRFGMQI